MGGRPKTGMEQLQLALRTVEWWGVKMLQDRIDEWEDGAALVDYL